MRLIGGLATRFHCHGPHSKHLRQYHDIDLLELRKEYNGILSVFQELGYVPNQEYNFLYGDTRLQFIDAATGGNVDVFLDKFRMGHTLDFRQRLRLDDLTIPITDLLLTKLQVVQFAEKDAKDIAAILEDHELGQEDGRETLNLEYVAELCSRDWGLHRTISGNLDRMKELIRKCLSNADGEEELLSKLDAVNGLLVTSRKSLRWRLRGLVGERVRWYREVEVGQGEVY